MDPFSTAAGVIAVIQIADRIISLCKNYLETVRDAPSDLRLIFIETSTLKTILESLNFLASYQQTTSLTGLLGDDGPVEASRKTLTELSNLFPSNYDTGTTSTSKRQKAKEILSSLAWPLKETKARKLLSELGQHKSTISLALAADCR